MQRETFATQECMDVATRSWAQQVDQGAIKAPQAALTLSFWSKLSASWMSVTFASLVMPPSDAARFTCSRCRDLV